MLDKMEVSSIFSISMLAEPSRTNERQDLTSCDRLALAGGGSTHATRAPGWEWGQYAIVMSPCVNHNRLKT
ncbi:hypothetical protein L484_000451 [Morus notabilis]|uniref:Uncharacterized protein n=1 Tax=Morus notabilis TaxID=981085 RepID=W9SDN9_9ROSA|nr:hypothetical protein L484_000451 [Morus notabilis]